MDNYNEILSIVLSNSDGEPRAVVYEDAEEIAQDLVNAGWINPTHT